MQCHKTSIKQEHTNWNNTCGPSPGLHRRQPRLSSQSGFVYYWCCNCVPSWIASASSESQLSQMLPHEGLKTYHSYIACALGAHWISDAFPHANAPMKKIGTLRPLQCNHNRIEESLVCNDWQPSSTMSIFPQAILASSSAAPSLNLCD